MMGQAANSSGKVLASHDRQEICDHDNCQGGNGLSQADVGQSVQGRGGGVAIT